MEYLPTERAFKPNKITISTGWSGNKFKVYHKPINLKGAAVSYGQGRYMGD